MMKTEAFLRDVPFPNASGQYLIVFFLIKAQVLSSFVCDADFHGQV